MEPTSSVFESHFEIRGFLEEDHGGVETGTSDADVNDLSSADVDDSFQRYANQYELSVLLALGDEAEAKEQVGDSVTSTDLPMRHEPNFKAKMTWFGTLSVAGLGMFVEAFVIITTGQIKTIWHDEYPECWTPSEDQHCPNQIQCCGLFPNTPTDGNPCGASLQPEGFCIGTGHTFPSNVLCGAGVTGAVSYAEFAGIMLGMLTFGYLGDRLGHKVAGTLTSILMVVGIAFMSFFDNSRTEMIFVVFSVFFFIFGVGVGGEYPLTASGAAAHHVQELNSEEDEHEEVLHKKRMLLDIAQTKRRGETMSLIFAMQGAGAVFGSFVLLALIYMSHQNFVDCFESGVNSSGNDPDALGIVWRASYLIGLIFVTMLLLYRWLVVEEGASYSKIQARKLRRQEQLGVSIANSRFKVLKFYSLRLLGTGGSWMVWDVAFYGLKLFSGPIFDDINPSGDLLIQNGYLLLSNFVALIGYYVAAYLIDKKAVGRRKLQLGSFFLVSIVFLLMGAYIDTAPAQVSMFLFFLSSFLGQGANVVTYVAAAETYPTELRATCHGLSAFMGKTGALVATIVFSSLQTSEIFYICGAMSLVGLVVTVLFSVDLNGVSLREHDVQLEMFFHDKLDEYKGKLNAPQHLSLVEQWTGRHGVYDPHWAKAFAAKRVADRTKSKET